MNLFNSMVLCHLNYLLGALLLFDVSTILDLRTKLFEVKNLLEVIRET